MGAGPAANALAGFWDSSSYWVALPKGRRLVLWQFDVPCFVDTYGRSAPFLTETEEWMRGGGRNMGGEEIGEEEGRETVVKM